MAARGLATAFAEAEVPTEYATKFKNRFINGIGGAEKRQGITQEGTTIAGLPNLNAIHELVKKDGTTTLFVSGGGAIYSYDGTSTFTQVHSGLSTTAVLRSVQMGDKLIFTNGVDRRFYTKDGTTFTELKAIIEKGLATAGTNTTTLADSDITNWIGGTDVAVNDLVYNATTSAYGVITAVASASLTHTVMGSAGNGDALGRGSANPASGNAYQIIDTVELNIVPGTVEDDNTATAAVGTSATGIRVSAVADWTKTEIRKGDFIYNSTRAAVTEVTAIATANIGVVGMSAQTNGDALIFLKSAMPISTFDHVHYGRCYSIDQRDQTKIRISGAADPEDMTTDAGTLDSITFSFGDLQPQGDTMVALGSFQRFFIMAGKNNMYAYEGTIPIGTGADFAPVGLFPQGTLSPDGVASLGNDLVFVGPDGLQSIALVSDASNLNRANVSEPIRKTIRDEIDAASTSDIKLVHYPRRSWLLLKIGSLMYCYNYTSFVGDPNKAVADTNGSWSLFDGKFAQQTAFKVRTDGDLVVAGPGGKVYLFDQDGYTDDGQNIATEYRTGFLTLDEPKRTTRRKKGIAIKPIIEAGDAYTVTINAEGEFDASATDTVSISTSGGAQPIGLAVIGDAIIGGSGVQNQKHPLRWRGEVVRIGFTTDHGVGPDILGRFTLYVNMLGRP